MKTFKFESNDPANEEITNICKILDTIIGIEGSIKVYTVDTQPLLDYKYSLFSRLGYLVYHNG